jgi:hypothetical protein
VACGATNGLSCGLTQPELKVQSPRCALEIGPEDRPRSRLVGCLRRANKANRGHWSQNMKTSYIAALCGMVLLAIAPSSSAFAQQKSAAACRAEWRANKAANQAAGKTEKAYVAECRSGAAPAARSAAPAPAPRASAPTRQIPAQPAPTRRAAAPTGANEFSTESEAKAHCPGDTVVWANTKSGIYHFSGHRSYGSTKAGAYMCEKDTAAAGIRAAKNEKHP